MYCRRSLQLSSRSFAVLLCHGDSVRNHRDAAARQIEDPLHLVLHRRAAHDDMIRFGGEPLLHAVNPALQPALNPPMVAPVFRRVDRAVERPAVCLLQIVCRRIDEPIMRMHIIEAQAFPHERIRAVAQGGVHLEDPIHEGGRSQRGEHRYAVDMDAVHLFVRRRPGDISGQDVYLANPACEIPRQVVDGARDSPPTTSGGNSQASISTRVAGSGRPSGRSAAQGPSPRHLRRAASGNRGRGSRDIPLPIAGAAPFLPVPP